MEFSKKWTYILLSNKRSFFKKQKLIMETKMIILVV